MNAQIENDKRKNFRQDLIQEMANDKIYKVGFEPSRGEGHELKYEINGNTVELESFIDMSTNEVK